MGILLQGLNFKSSSEDFVAGLIIRMCVIQYVKCILKQYNSI